MADKPSPKPVPKASHTTQGTMLPPQRRPGPSFSSPFPSLSSNSSANTSTTAQPYPFSAHLMSHNRMASPAQAQTPAQRLPAAAAANATASPHSKPAHAPGQAQGKMDITTLMSPPDQVMDNFPQDAQNAMGPLFNNAGTDQPSSPPLLMSPPHSPIHRTLDPPVRDVFKMPRAPVHTGRPVQELERVHRQAIEQHRRENPFDADINRPSDNDYLLTLSFRSKIMDRFREDPRAWLRKNLAQVRHDNRVIAHRYLSIMPAKHRTYHGTQSRAARGPRADRVAKPSTTPAATAPRVIRTAGSPTGSTSPESSKRSPGRAGATPEPARKAAAPNREDKDFESIPNYAPDAWKTLPSGNDCLKVEWKGQPVDLTNDPHAHLLHPAELVLASILRLDCATYLTSKRRMFERRLACLKQPKDFRKTDAQQACKIDVNKASKLWQAYDKVGWLDERFMDPFV